MQAPGVPTAFRVSPWWTAVLILGLALGCYWPALHGGMLWDDQAHVTKPELRSLMGLGRIWFDLYATQQYYPVLHSAFWFEHRLWGEATLGYHLVNVLLHATAAGLLVVVLRRLRLQGAVLAGLIFTVHPVCVESVAWISEQKNTLSLVFYLLAALAYLRFDRDRDQPGATGAYFGASFLFGLALLTKTVTATLPAALLVIVWWQRGRLSWRRDVLPLLPWFAVALATGLFTGWVERKLIGAEGATFDLTLAQRCLLAGRVIWFYLEKMLWPVHLVFFYPRWNVSSAAAGWAGYLGAAMAVTAALWLLHHRWRGPLAAWLFFVGSLFPALGFFNVYPFIHSYVADHFQYLASLGVITAVSAGATLLYDCACRQVRAAGWVIGAALIVTLGLLSRAESRTYIDLHTLYQTTVERNPECWMAQNNLGTELLELNSASELPRAMAYFEAALRIRPDYAEAHNNLGNVLLKIPGRLNDAIAHYQEAVRLNPNLADAHYNLAIAWSKMPGRLNDAISQYLWALRLVDFADARYNLANALLKVPGRLNDAVVQYEAALRMNPTLADAHYNLGTALLKVPGRLDDAIAHQQQALRLKPDYAEAHNNLGSALSNIPGRLNDAIAEYQAALRLKPDLAEAYYNLAVALLQLPGHNDEAKRQLEAFLRLRPDSDQALRLLAEIQASKF